MGISQQIGASSVVKWGVCTSSTRPASPYHGQHIYETDTNLQFVWNGSAWVNNYASSASPTFTGVPAAPTATAGTNTTQLATTGFVTAADNLKANLASPALSGTPTAPTATAGTNTTQLATTAFANSAGGYVYIAGGSFTGVNTFDVTGFSTNHLFYELKMFIAGTSAVTGQLVSGSTVRNTNYYGSTFYTQWNGPYGILDLRGNGANFFLTDLNTAPPSSVSCFITGVGQNEFNINISSFENVNTRTVTGGYSNYAGGGTLNSFDKMRFTSAANMAGSWTLMGVRKP